ncbi:hypothetical protein BK649_01575 [Pseudomonas canadensis]|uniref:Uncharacterized protein n=1 Tax=Pseudomonas canadensis TaxID=915099 RepID=A0A423FGQ0_9PSED|nr:hypothetical protein [Pseudomonas canadensis]ROM56903.1 hypothetical protein BK649_01575 [Pseudomonas canadensis]
MSIMNHPPVNPTARTGTQGMLQLTREEVRVLHYYRALSDDDREAARCLLQALQAPTPDLARSSAPEMPSQTTCRSAKPILQIKL